MHPNPVYGFVSVKENPVKKTIRFVKNNKFAIAIGIVAITVVGRQQREIERLHEELEKYTLA